MPHPTIRRACAADLPDLLRMVHALAGHHGDVATLSRETLDRDVFGPDPWLRVFVATQGNQCIGYAALVQIAQLQFGVRGFDMHHLFVKDTHRGQGIGRLLIDACITYAKEQSCRFMTVGTHPENHKAQEVYVSAGFERRPPSGPRFSIKW